MKGKLIKDQYCILQTLGQSVFSETYLASQQHQFQRRRYVIKKFRPILGNPQANAIKQMFYQEASVLKRLSGENPQIPKLYEYFMDGEDFYLVREWVEGLTLEQKVQQQGLLPATEVEQILESILACLKHIHSHGIVYRMLTPSTIILNSKLGSNVKSPVPMLIYFGGVKELELQIGSPHPNNLVPVKQLEYVSPEQERGKSVFASDFYSLGLTAIYLLTGKTPRELSYDFQTKQINWQPEQFQVKVNLVRVIERAICNNPQERFDSADTMLKALRTQPINLAPPTVQHTPAKKAWLSRDRKVIFMLCGLGVSIISLAFILINLDFSQLSRKREQEQLLSRSDGATPTDFELITNAEPSKSPTKKSNLPFPSAPVGMTQEEITTALGSPSEADDGYWPNSRTLTYPNILPQPISLSYLYDQDSLIIRQAELVFDNSVDLVTILESAEHLLQEKYTPEVEHAISQIYLNTSLDQEFVTQDLEGIVQRNDQEHIYLAVWDQEFH